MNRFVAKAKRLISKEFLAVCQLVVAAIMMLSLVQMNKSLEYTKDQIEASKVPAIEITEYHPDGIVVRNVGGLEIEEFRIRARMAVQLKDDDDKTIDYISLNGLQLDEPPLSRKLAPGQGFPLLFSQFPSPFRTYSEAVDPKEKAKHEASPSPEVWAIVLSFKRHADGRQFYKFICIRRYKTGQNPISVGPGKPKHFFLDVNGHMYFPMTLVPNWSTSGDKADILGAAKLRDEIEEIFSASLGIKQQDIVD